MAMMEEAAAVVVVVVVVVVVDAGSYPGLAGPAVAFVSPEAAG
ncbi:hypothetical protein [Pontibacter sp. E15-1]|nr:hypothetical protein [Pontibacter sp. E15-1]